MFVQPYRLGLMEQVRAAPAVLDAPWHTSGASIRCMGVGV